MKASFSHVKINVSEPAFYKEFLIFLGFELYMEYAGGFGVTDDSDVSIWVFKTKKGHTKDINFEDSGLNHLAFNVGGEEEVDRFYKEYLLPKNVEIIHEPKEYHAYNHGKGYYAVFFESPDRIKLEVAWVA
jgi:catechol 2,3-dioxygenase-like lactoylglutathione lyase family enzyme